MIVIGIDEDAPVGIDRSSQSPRESLSKIVNTPQFELLERYHRGQALATHNLLHGRGKPSRALLVSISKQVHSLDRRESLAAEIEVRDV